MSLGGDSGLIFMPRGLRLFGNRLASVVLVPHLAAVGLPDAEIVGDSPCIRRGAAGLRCPELAADCRFRASCPDSPLRLRQD
jgi:hypothetical protein